MHTQRVLKLSSQEAYVAQAQSVAVLIPCHNEAATIGQVVADFRAESAVHALELNFPCGEQRFRYSERPEGSASKLRTFRDGARIPPLILRLAKDERPLRFLSVMAVFNPLVAMVLIAPIVATWLATGLVPRSPTAILSLGLVIISVLCFFTGLILAVSTGTRQEIKRLLNFSAARQAGR